MSHPEGNMMAGPNFMAIHPLVFKILQPGFKWWTNRPREPCRKHRSKENEDMICFQVTFPLLLLSDEDTLLKLHLLT